MTGIILFPQKAILNTYNWTQNSKYFQDFDELISENVELKNEIKKLKEKNADYDLIKSENQLFKEKDKVSKEFENYKTIVAEIIAFNPNNFERIFTINKGYEDGIKEKMTVLTVDGLVGYISKVSDKTSNITAIIDASTSFSARNTNTKDLFVAGGTMALMDSNELLAKEIPFGSTFHSGDIIETSGIGSLFPRGIKVGTITSVQNDANPLETSAIIDSGVDFNKLDIVAVIINGDM